jgi:hypothetical protein
MPRELALTGPLPPTGIYWCTMCANRYKAEALAIDSLRAEVETLATGDGPALRYDMPKKIREHGGKVEEPQEAVTIGFNPQLGMIPLCWSHMQAIKFTSVMPAAAGSVPLLQGR